MEMNVDHFSKKQRVDWVDYAKGISIILIVMMHTTVGIEKYAQASTWMGHAVAYAQPFRIPAFFLIAGLFLYRTIDKSWGQYLDKKVVHFLYFYVLWAFLQITLKSLQPLLSQGPAPVLEALAFALIQPFGTLWFIYMLPVFFVVTKLLRSTSPWLVGLAALALHLASVHTGSLIIDEFCSRYVFFFAGYALSSSFFRLSEWSLESAGRTVALLAIWALFNGLIVFGGVASLPGVAFVLGGLGACALIMVATLLSKTSTARWLQYCGQQSIVIYLAFFLTMGPMRVVFLKLCEICDHSLLALFITFISVITPLVVHAIVMRIKPLHFLFERPNWAKLKAA
jgi:uncharacterized membrane protein YcfT